MLHFSSMSLDTLNKILLVGQFEVVAVRAEIIVTALSITSEEKGLLQESRLQAGVAPYDIISEGVLRFLLEDMTTGANNFIQFSLESFALLILRSSSRFFDDLALEFL